MKGFVTRWKASTNRAKQRKYAANAPKHTKRKMLSATLSKELKKIHGKNNVPLRTGDTVKIMRGQFKKKVGKVAKTELNTSKVFIEGIELKKNDGTKAQYPVHASNLQITNLTMEDQKRKKSIARGVTKK